MSRILPTILFALLLPPSLPAEEPAPKPGIDLEKGRAFWSFQPLQVVKPPDVNNASWVRTNLDRFIVSALETRGLTPNEEADRRTLIRRLTFGLWGLPPERSEVEQFLADSSPDAYERLVDRLLAGEHYGERWARHWLDLARFAESNGYAFDQDRGGAYHFRDFVIKAFNDDMPYDRFVQLQIAGDQIEPESYAAQAATGFLAAGPFTSQQTQKERERSRYEQLDDVVGTMGTAMLGLTVGCARCHDHKYDPLPMKDYYRFVSCFAETGFQDYAHDPDPAKTKAERAKFEAAHKPLVEARTQFEKEALPDRLATWIAALDEPQSPEKLGDWHHIGPFEAADFKKAYAEAFAPEKEIDLAKSYGDDLVWTPRPEWKDGQVHKTLLGSNSANYLYRTIEVEEARSLDISLGRDDAIKVWLNGESVLAKEVQGGAAPDQDKVTLSLRAGVNALLMKIVNGGGESGFYFHTKPNIPKNIHEILAVAADKRSDEQKATLLKWFAPRDPDWAKLNQAEQEHAKTAPKPATINVLAARKGGTTYNFGADTRKVYFLERGESNSKQGLASPGFLRVLQKDGADEKRWLSMQTAEEAAALPPRVALAHWITDEQHGAGHLLARVIVNRLWQHHLGRGIVTTPSDFGSQGAAPTHPELLDYLAGELIRAGWQLKPIHRLILMSAVYRQSGQRSELAEKVDPENALFWRRGATRLEAEVIRDSLLAVGDTLDKTMFGKGALDQTNPRRSVYLTVKRSNLIPILQLFDAPDAMQSIGDRGATTVPPQALAMMNSPFVRQVAEKFAKRIRPSASATPEGVVEQAYWLSLSRPPTDAERQQMIGFIKSQAGAYGDDSGAMDLAVADYCQLMLCLNEFVFID